MRYIKIQFLQHWQDSFHSFGVLDSPVLEILSYHDMLLNLLLKSLISCRNLIYDLSASARRLSFDSAFA